MIQEVLEGLAEKIMQDALENIRRLGYVVMVRERASDKSFWMHTQIEPKNVVVISEERAKRGDY
jgi:hypothetical protein